MQDAQQNGDRGRRAAESESAPTRAPGCGVSDRPFSGQLRGRILTDTGWIDGQLTFADSRIVSIDGDPLPIDADPKDLCVSQTASSSPPALIVPGFIDLHVHGGGGADCMEGAQAMRTMARLHARHGTTSLLATTMTAPREKLAAVLAEIGADLRDATERTEGTEGADSADSTDRADRTDKTAPAARPGPWIDSARVLGVHLEGPYINPARLGAQPDAAVVPVLDEVVHYLSLAPIRVVTLAPEIQGRLDIIAELASRGIRVQLGHTVASYEQACTALAHGAAGFTHLFNAMSPLQHRAPGAVGAALAHARFSELIPDLLHVHPGAMLAAFRAIPYLYGVTDGTAACGMPDGDYKLGSQDVNKCLGAVRLADGTLAGSTLTMDVALRNLVKIGLPLADASARLSRYPADYLGIGERGRLAVGAFADINVLDASLALTATYVEGRRVASVGATTDGR